LRPAAKLDGKGSYPKNAVDPPLDWHGAVNESTAFQGHLRCAQGLGLLSRQRHFSQQFPEE
jgi:hypothetical protein